MTKNKINIAVLGASGYTGGDLIRILIGHEKKQEILPCQELEFISQQMVEKIGST